MLAKEVVVYWAYSNNESMRGKEPYSVLKKHVKDLAKDSPSESDGVYMKCPAFQSLLKNVYAVYSLFDFELSVDRANNHITSSLVEFEKTIEVRGENLTLFSISAFLNLFTEEDGLEVSQISAFLEDNEFVRDTITIPGRLDISKWYRPIEQAVRFRKGVDKISVGLDDVVFYLDFNTEKKIKFVRYEMSERLEELASKCVRSKDEKRKVKKLSYYYGLFKRNNYKEKVLEEIKKNIL